MVHITQRLDSPSSPELLMSFSLWRLGYGGKTLLTGFEYFVSSGNQFVDKVCCLGGEEEELYMSRKKL